ncbi:methylmalonyl-CoA mutase family protein [Deinococcus sp. VB142]|uniref:Methylmalonyl-CoA mutase family protein n=1 Tax=Deinococcus sp. VB142 TaxID=3112952 RepID=A0AAU6Q2T9_9DEIO
MKTKNEWMQSVYAPATQKFPERKYNFKNLSDMDPEPIYTADDLKDWDAERDLGYPGEFPYTRGVQSSVYRGKLWTMRMFAGFGSAEQTNERFHSLLKAGQTGLSTAFDLPTLMGYDSDHPFSKGEVGKCGVAVSSLADMEILFRGIDPEAVTTSMTINSPANAIWAMYIANAQKQGKDLNKVGGTIQNDILKEFIAQKEFIYPPSPSVKLVIDTFEWGPKVLPKWNFISVSGYHIREAGATGVQELAFTLADGFHYVEKALERGLDIDEFAPRISFFWDIHNDFFEEIAKLRAARRIWARQMRDRYGAKNPKSWMLRTHRQTAGVSVNPGRHDLPEFFRAGGNVVAESRELVHNGRESQPAHADECGQHQQHRQASGGSARHEPLEMAGQWVQGRGENQCQCIASRDGATCPKKLSNSKMTMMATPTGSRFTRNTLRCGAGGGVEGCVTLTTQGMTPFSVDSSAFLESTERIRVETNTVLRRWN